MRYTIDSTIEEIQKVLNEAKRYNYNDFVINQDLKKILQEFERQTIEYTYEETKEEFKSRLNAHFEDIRDYLDDDN